MTGPDSASNPRARECESLMQACTPQLYRHNAFRITGAIVEASARDIKRRIDDLKHSHEIGEAKEEHTHAFAIRPAPDYEQIRDATLRLQDPERRLIDEFFWFWPMSWGSGKTDTALLALANDNRESPVQLWTAAIASQSAEHCAIGRHNLAVMYQLVALDGEHANLKKGVSDESLSRMDRYWRKSFQWWEELADDEVFWSVLSERIRIVDDPRLTTGYARRIRATLPKALDQVNALLAMQYIDKGKLELAQRHIVYMKETHQGLDDTTQTLKVVTKSLLVRHQSAVERASEVADKSPSGADAAAMELIVVSHRTINILQVVYAADSHELLDICDSVVATVIRCATAFVLETNSWDSCIGILDEARSFARTEQAISDLTKARTAARTRRDQSHPLVEGLLNALKSTERLDPRTRVKVLYATIPQLLAKIEKELGRSTAVYEDCADFVAIALRSVAVDLHNTVLPSEPDGTRVRVLAITVLVHDRATAIACDTELKAQLKSDEASLQALRTSLSAMDLQGLLRRELMRDGHLPLWGDSEVLQPATHAPQDSSNAGCALGLFVAAVVVVAYLSIANTSQEPSSNTSQEPSPPASAAAPAVLQPAPRAHAILAQEIEDRKARATIMEAQLAEMQSRLDGYERRMKSHEALGQTAEYNALVPLFNMLASERSSVYDTYSRLVDEINVKVVAYNALIKR